MSQADYEILASFRYAMRRFLHFSEQAAKAVGLTPQQHQALLAIRGFSGASAISIGELAERLQVKHHSAVGLVNRLVVLELVVRESDTNDHRLVHLHLTKRGVEVLHRLSAIHRDELRRISPVLGELLNRIS